MDEPRLTLELPLELRAEIHTHCEAGYPQEVAGLLVGAITEARRLVHHVMPLPNVFPEHSRATRYQISPQAMIEAERAADDLGLDVIGVFHSHPDHPAEPSDFDRKMALPWFVYLITSVRQGHAVEDRAWRLDDDRDRFDEVDLKTMEVRLT